ncbi:MAG: hypothetical protein HY306_10110 [Nitrosomonadales bacterium]|nr:hypothetical protein [Nitrosomonadales bacterium]
MSEPKNYDKTSTPAVDVFNTKPVSDSSAAPGADTVTTPPTAPPIKGATWKNALIAKAAKLKPVHFVVLSVAIAVLWIFGPHLLRSSANERQPQSLDVVSSDPITVPENNSTTPQGATNSAAGPAHPEAVTPPSPSEIELQSKVDELQRRVALLEAALTNLVMRNNLTIQKEPTAAPPAPKPKAKRAASASLGKPKTLSEFTLNTIYRDQAWIQNDERTYIVQVGDTLNGLFILRIDPAARLVSTSNGVIR